MTPPRTAAEMARSLRLHRHLEGGWYAETYRAERRIPAEVLPAAYEGSRAAATSILFLLERGDVSRLHRLRSDELWHYHAGDPLLLHVLTPDGVYFRSVLGPDPTADHLFQVPVLAGCWFGAESSGDWSLVGCAVAPGFEYHDFELGKRADLVAQFPEHRELIERLTRG
jgi:predicted cupin superfamily sugar epimerase